MSKHILKPKYLLIHCSDYGKQHTASTVHVWHVKRGWAGLGYHDIIDMDGKHERGRPWYWKGSHCYKARMNHQSLGVCLLGKRVFTDAQYNALACYILRVVKRFPDIIVAGHGDFDSDKTCPNFDVAAWIKTREELSHVKTL